MSSPVHPASKTVADVKRFWEQNPLWTGESRFPPGTRDFYEEHARIIIEDGFAGKIDERIFPSPSQQFTGRVLDLGCGPGFWTVELARRGFSVCAADLTNSALELARKRCHAYGVTADFSLQNAEDMNFPDAAFAHVNCQGVIHHTPDTEACVGEIARVLAPGGTASISVYYRNIILRAWPAFYRVGGLIRKFGGTLKGRGREDIYATRHVDDIVRLYDGKDNPVGKCYTRSEFVRMLEPFFFVRETFLHFFPARTFPFPMTQQLHRLLDRSTGFLIYASVVKR
jgi:SAM-dependent methyltransferase